MADYDLPKKTVQSGPFPHETYIQPFWRSELHPLDDHRSTEDLPTECDILIVGAGYAGVTTAYHLLNDNPDPPSIVLLEARQACSGATARNGGHVRPEIYFYMPEYIKKHGLEMAAAISNFEISHVQALKDLVEKEQIDCDFTLGRSMDVFLDEAHAVEAKRAYDKLKESGLVSLKDVQYTSAKNAEIVSGVRGAKGCFSFTAANIWAYKLILHLLSLVVARGVNLQTTTTVISVAPKIDPTDGKWLVTTSRGLIKASKIVFASNGYTAGIAPEYARKIVPCRGICARITGLNGSPLPYLQNSYVIRSGPGIYDYLLSRPDGSVVIGGARSTFLHDKKTWYDTTNDDELIESARNYFDGFMQKSFRGWENTGAMTERVWTGIMGYTSDSLPHIGVVPNVDVESFPPSPPPSSPPTPSTTTAASNLLSKLGGIGSNRSGSKFIAAGFNGHGMPVIFRATKALASMILHGKRFEETGLPGVYETTLDRLKHEQDNHQEA